MNTLFNLLQPKAFTEIVDIGANPIDGEPSYKPMLQASLCHVSGFEPQESALLDLLSRKSEYEQYFSYAVGDGECHTLNICRYSGMTSLFELNENVVSLFETFRHNGEVLYKEKIQTKRLDDIDEIEHVDMLKIDIQGGELSVFQNGRVKLSQAVVIQTEVSFMTLYKNQPTFGEIDIEMRQQGFVPHCFTAIKNWPISPCIFNNSNKYQPHQLLEADIVYIRDLSNPNLLSDEQLKQMALIMHYCYSSVDIVLRCIMILEERGILMKMTYDSYLKLL